MFSWCVSSEKVHCVLNHALFIHVVINHKLIAIFIGSINQSEYLVAHIRILGVVRNGEEFVDIAAPLP